MNTKRIILTSIFFATTTLSAVGLLAENINFSSSNYASACNKITSDCPCPCISDTQIGVGKKIILSLNQENIIENINDMETKNANINDDIQTTEVSLSMFLKPKISKEMIDFYETNIAKKKVVSNASPARIEKLASSFNISTDKVKAIIILQDFLAKTGKKVTLQDLAKMSDFEVMKIGRKSAKEYAKTLPEQEREELKSQLKSLF